MFEMYNKDFGFADLLDKTDDRIISEVNCVTDTESDRQRNCWDSTRASAEPSAVPEDEHRPEQLKLEDWKHSLWFSELSS